MTNDKKRAPTLLIGPFSRWDRMRRLFGSREAKRTLFGRSPARPQPPQPEPRLPTTARSPSVTEQCAASEPLGFPHVPSKAPCLLPTRTVQQKAQRVPTPLRLSSFLLAQRVVCPEWTSLPTVHARAWGLETAGTEEPRVLQMRKLLAGQGCQQPLSVARPRANSGLNHFPLPANV